jgi:hypothetical protein
MEAERVENYIPLQGKCHSLLTYQNRTDMFYVERVQVTYECAGDPCNAQGFVAENLNIFSTTVTLILMDQEMNSVL